MNGSVVWVAAHATTKGTIYITQTHPAALSYCWVVLIICCHPSQCPQLCERMVLETSSKNEMNGMRRFQIVIVLGSTTTRDTVYSMVEYTSPGPESCSQWVTSWLWVSRETVTRVSEPSMSMSQSTVSYEQVLYSVLRPLC